MTTESTKATNRDTQSISFVPCGNCKGTGTIPAPKAYVEIKAGRTYTDSSGATYHVTHYNFDGTAHFVNGEGEKRWMPAFDFRHRDGLREVANNV